MTDVRKEQIIRMAVNHADKQWEKGLLISVNHPNYDELMSDPSTHIGDRDTVYSVASLFNDIATEDIEDEILNALEKKYKSYF